MISSIIFLNLYEYIKTKFPILRKIDNISKWINNQFQNPQTSTNLNEFNLPTNSNKIDKTFVIGLKRYYKKQNEKIQKAKAEYINIVNTFNDLNDELPSLPPNTSYEEIEHISKNLYNSSDISLFSSLAKDYKYDIKEKIEKAINSIKDKILE